MKKNRGDELTYVQYISEILFFLFVVLVLAGGIIAVNSRVLIHAILGLSVSMMGIAGLYLYLGSIFMTVMQALVYGGVVCIILIFGIMAGYTPVEVFEKGGSGKNTSLALTACLLMAGLLGYFVMTTTWNPGDVKVGDIPLIYLGEMLISQYSIACGLIFFVFLLALLGSMILVKGGRKTDREIRGYKKSEKREEGVTQ